MVVDSSTSKPEEMNNQMYLIDFRSHVTNSENFEGALQDTIGVWDDIYERMDPSEILWVILDNEYRDGRCWPAAMAFADRIRKEAQLDLKNTITVHSYDKKDNKGSALTPSYSEILLLVRDKHKYQFHKDRIRIEHVYKGNEWGGERNEGNSAYHDTKVTRYNENGRDPGNVWMREIRDETPDQSVDRTEPIALSEAIERCVLVGSEEGEQVFTYGIDEELEATIIEYERQVERFSLENNEVANHD